jgi:hypothetical protein
VPLGASSASMYPGYSPADHIYGEAASEFGKHVAELKKKGIEVLKEPVGSEYNITPEQKAGHEQTDEAKQQSRQESRHHSGSQVGEAEPMEGVEETEPSQLFVIDSNPTPVAPFQANLTTSLTKSKNKANDKAKRRTSTDGDQVVDVSEEAPKKKKVKMSTEPDDLPSDDFEAEVEAKHREKEERRKSKKDKKRKRDSDPSGLAADVTAEESKIEKPKKKKSKKDKAVEDDAKLDGETAKKRKKVSAESPDAIDGEKKEKTKRIKS